MSLGRIERIENKQDRIADDIGENPHKARRFQRLQEKQERIANRQIRKGNLTPEEFAEIDQNREIAQELKNIQHEVIDKKLEGIESSVEIQNLMNDIDELQKQLPFIKRGESHEEKLILDRYNVCLKACEKVLRKNNAYSRKLWRGHFNEDIRRPDDMTAMLSQMRILLENAKSTASKVMTGQYGKEKIVNQNPQGVKNTSNQKENYNTSYNYNSLGEAFEKKGILGVFDFIGQETNLSPGYRSGARSALTVGVIGGLIYGFRKAKEKYGWLKTIGGIVAGDLALRMGTGYATGKSMSLPSILTQAYRGGDLTRSIMNIGSESGSTTVSEHKEPEVTTLDKMRPSLLVSGALKDIPFVDYTTPYHINGKDSTILDIQDGEIVGINMKTLEYYVEHHQTLSESEKDNRKTYIKEYNKKSRKEQAVLQTLLAQGFQDLDISYQTIQDNPSHSLTDNYETKLNKLAKQAEQDKQAEVKESTEYNGKDAAKIKPQLATIESQLNNSQKETFQKLNLEKVLNILYQQHPKARPIMLGYENGRLSLNTYDHKCAIDIFNNTISVYSPYSSTPWEANTIQEAVNIANLINFTTATYSGSSDFNGPFNLSYDGTEQDIEFSKTGGRTSGFAGMDITILEDTWLNSFDTDFPSINNNKQAFVERMNDFKTWNKNNPEFQEVRTIEEKLKNDYGINETVDVEKGNRKFAGLLKSLGLQRSEGLSSKEYREVLVQLDQVLSKFPQKLLQKTKLNFLELGKNADFNGKREGTARGVTRKRPGGFVEIQIDAKADIGVNHLVAHEYVHNLIYKNQSTSPIDKRTKLSEGASAENLNKSGSITPYGMTSPEEDICEIAGVLFNGGSISPKFQAKLSENSDWSGNLFERIKTDPVLLKKVEVFTGCKIDPNSSTPFVRKLTSAERQAYGFDQPAFFSERSRDAGEDIDEDYWNNLKTV